MPIGLDTGLALGVGVLCAVLVSLALLQRWRLRGATGREVTREQRARTRELRGVRAGLEELLHQIETVAAQAEQQVRARTEQLKTLIRVADERIARLSERRPAARSTPTRTQPAPSPPETLSPAPSPSAARSTAPPAPVRAPLAPPRSAPIDPPATLRPATDWNTLARRTNELADEGQSPTNIAAALRWPVGEIELILNLREFRQEQAAQT